jgi:hypothetical protein
LRSTVWRSQRDTKINKIKRLSCIAGKLLRKAEDWNSGLIIYHFGVARTAALA